MTNEPIEPSSPIQSTDNIPVVNGTNPQTRDPELDRAIRALETGKPPTPQAGAENASEGNLDGKQPAPEAATEVPEDASGIDRARFVQLAKAERRIAEREKRAREQLKAAEERAKAAEAKEQELDALFNSKDPKAFLERSKMSMDDFARLYLGLEPEAPKVEDKLTALEKRIEEREQAEQKAREQYEQAQRQQAMQAAQQRDLGKVRTIVDALPDEYELVRTNEAYAHVLKRAYAFLQSPDARDLYTPDGKLALDEEQERKIVSYFAKEVEDELTEHARNAYERITKAKKLQSLLGISSNNNDTIKDTNQFSADTLATAALQDKQVTARPSKFITNDTTVSSKPVVATRTLPASGYRKAQSQIDAEMIDELVKTMGIK